MISRTVGNSDFRRSTGRSLRCRAGRDDIDEVEEGEEESLAASVSACCALMLSRNSRSEGDEGDEYIVIAGEADSGADADDADDGDEDEDGDGVEEDVLESGRIGESTQVDEEVSGGGLSHRTGLEEGERSEEVEGEDGFGCCTFSVARVSA